MDDFPFGRSFVVELSVGWGGWDGFCGNGDLALACATGGDCSMNEDRLFFFSGNGDTNSSCCNLGIDAGEAERWRFLLGSEVMVDEVALGFRSGRGEEMMT